MLRDLPIASTLLRRRSRWTRLVPRRHAARRRSMSPTLDADAPSTALLRRTVDRHPRREASAAPRGGDRRRPRRGRPGGSDVRHAALLAARRGELSRGSRSPRPRSTRTPRSRRAPGYGCDGPDALRVQRAVPLHLRPRAGRADDVRRPDRVHRRSRPEPRRSDQYFASASGPLDTWTASRTTGRSRSTATSCACRCADAVGGTSIEFEVWHTPPTRSPASTVVDGTLTSGALTASASSRRTPRFEIDSRRSRRTTGSAAPGTTRPATASRCRRGASTTSGSRPQYRAATTRPADAIDGPALDEDYFLVDPPAPGERLVISTNATDGQIALALFSQSAPTRDLGIESAGRRARNRRHGAERDAGGSPPRPAAMRPLRSPDTRSSTRPPSGGGGTRGESRRPRRMPRPDERDAAAGHERQRRGQHLAVLAACPLHRGARRVGVRTVDVTAAQTPIPRSCRHERPGDRHHEHGLPGRHPAVRRHPRRRGGGRGARGARHARRHAGTSAPAAVDGARALGRRRPRRAQPRAATLDANPCSMSARARPHRRDQRLRVDAARRPPRADRLGRARRRRRHPPARAGRAAHRRSSTRPATPASLRLPDRADGACPPASVAEEPLDACATPLSAAAATNHILTDDPYGLADAYESLGGYLYVPTVGVGRLVESPAQIIAAIDRFVAADGVLEADSTLTGGYGAWAELPAARHREPRRGGRRPRTRRSQRECGQVLDQADAARALPGGGQSPGVVSINTHADETRMLPGIHGAETARSPTPTC